MKRTIASLVTLTAVMLAAAAARADGDAYSCCDLSMQDGACIGQSAECAAPSGFGVMLWDPIDPTTAMAWTLPASVASSSFPDGTDGYVSLGTQAPWQGFCLDAPSTSDPQHEGPTEPITCLTLSLLPGIAGEAAVATVPLDGRWDGYQLCYGAPTGDSDAGPCRAPSTMNDPTIAPTPVSGSCCGPAHPLTSGRIIANQEVPGLPTAFVAVGPDGGQVPYYNSMEGDSIADNPDACASAYGQSSTCGQGPGDGGKCVPTTCEAQRHYCGAVPDGCGGMLDCSGNCQALAAGSCSMTRPGITALQDDAAIGGGLALLVGLAFARKPRRR
jgi:hypothetical protein